MRVLEQYSQAKGEERWMEDYLAITPDYIAVFDGATPKTAFRFAYGRTPGQVVAQTLAESIKTLPVACGAKEAADLLTLKVRAALNGHSGEASGVFYSRSRNEIWRIGDCGFGFIDQRGEITTNIPTKRIDLILSEWRAAVVKSYLSRGLASEQEIRDNDPGRRIIQPFISRQPRYQNRKDKKEKTQGSLTFGVFDGTDIPEELIEIIAVPHDTQAIILASDGYADIKKTLHESEIAMQHLWEEDPLCIGPLLGTKAIRTGNHAHDDRTYVKFVL